MSIAKQYDAPLYHARVDDEAGEAKPVYVRVEESTYGVWVNVYRTDGQQVLALIVDYFGNELSVKAWPNDQQDRPTLDRSMMFPVYED